MSDKLLRRQNPRARRRRRSSSQFATTLLLISLRVSDKVGATQTRILLSSFEATIASSPTETRTIQQAKQGPDSSSISKKRAEFGRLIPSYQEYEIATTIDPKTNTQKGGLDAKADKITSSPKRRRRNAATNRAKQRHALRTDEDDFRRSEEPTVERESMYKTKDLVDGGIDVFRPFSHPYSLSSDFTATSNQDENGLSARIPLVGTASTSRQSSNNSPAENGAPFAASTPSKYEASWPLDPAISPNGSSETKQGSSSLSSPAIPVQIFTRAPSASPPSSMQVGDFTPPTTGTPPHSDQFTFHVHTMPPAASPHVANDEIPPEYPAFTGPPSRWKEEPSSPAAKPVVLPSTHMDGPSSPSRSANTLIETCPDYVHDEKNVLPSRKDSPRDSSAIHAVEMNFTYEVELATVIPSVEEAVDSSDVATVIGWLERRILYSMVREFDMLECKVSPTPRQGKRVLDEVLQKNAHRSSGSDRGWDVPVYETNIRLLLDDTYSLIGIGFHLPYKIVHIGLCTSPEIDVNTCLVIQSHVTFVFDTSKSKNGINIIAGADNNIKFQKIQSQSLALIRSMMENSSLISRDDNPGLLNARFIVYKDEKSSPSAGDVVVLKKPSNSNLSTGEHTIDDEKRSGKHLWTIGIVGGVLALTFLVSALVRRIHNKFVRQEDENSVFVSDDEESAQTKPVSYITTLHHGGASSSASDVSSDDNTPSLDIRTSRHSRGLRDGPGTWRKSLSISESSAGTTPPRQSIWRTSTSMNDSDKFAPRAGPSTPPHMFCSRSGDDKNGRATEDWLMAAKIAPLATQQHQLKLEPP